MKRHILAAILLLSVLTMQAQSLPSCAVFQLQYGEGVNAQDVEGITFMFRSNFNPVGYSIIDFDKVDMKVRQLGFKPTGMTPQQLQKVGRALYASVMVVGTISKFMDEYSVTIVAYKTENYGVVADENAMFERAKFRDNMRKLAQNFAGKLGKSSSSNGSSSSSTGTQTSSQTSGGTTVQAGYTDLGLPSGTIWKNSNEPGFYSYNEAVSCFGMNLPSKQQFEELLTCDNTWTGKGVKFTGPNGNSIVLPAMGWRDCDGDVHGDGPGLSTCIICEGCYWSFTSRNKVDAWYLRVPMSNRGVTWCPQCVGLSVRLVQDN